MSENLSVYAQKFLSLTGSKPVSIVAVNSTDAIIAAAILVQACKRLDKKFSVKVIDKTSPLPSPSAQSVLVPLGFSSVQENEGAFMIPTSQATLAEDVYLFVQGLSSNNRDLSKIALVSIIAQNPSIQTTNINEQILSDVGEIITKKGPTLYSSTRPLRRAIEYATTQYIPGVTGNSNGVLGLLKEAQISHDKTLLELTEEEIGRLTAAVMLRLEHRNSTRDLSGSVYALDLFNRKEDLREIAVLINSCAKLGHEDIALAYCLGHEKARTRAFDVYTQYKQEIIAALKTVETAPTVTGKGFVIIDLQNNIRSKLLATICSIIADSCLYEQGMIVLMTTVASNGQVKFAAKAAGSTSRDLHELFSKSSEVLVEESGHEPIAIHKSSDKVKCRIEASAKEQFLEALKKNLEVEVLKI